MDGETDTVIDTQRHRHTERESGGMRKAQGLEVIAAVAICLHSYCQERTPKEKEIQNECLDKGSIAAGICLYEISENGKTEEAV